MKRSDPVLLAGNVLGPVYVRNAAHLTRGIRHRSEVDALDMLFGIGVWQRFGTECRAPHDRQSLPYPAISRRGALPDCCWLCLRLSKRELWRAGKERGNEIDAPDWAAFIKLAFFAEKGRSIAA